jgi:hypothetical protein
LKVLKAEIEALKAERELNVPPQRSGTDD